MNIPTDLHYLGLGAASFLLALVLVPPVRAFGRRFGFMDAPDPRKAGAVK